MLYKGAPRNYSPVAVNVVKELELKNPRHARHTLVQGLDGKHYKVFTFQLYDMPPPKEFPTHEVSVHEVNADGSWSVLIQLYLKRFFDKAGALEDHERLLKEFDKVFGLKVPEPKHK